MKLFSADTYHSRRLELISKVESGVIWILGNGESPKNYKDNPFSFRQDSHFLYFAGINKPDLSLIIDVDQGKSYLCGQDPSMDDIVWTGPTPSISEWATLVGIEDTLSPEKAEQYLQQAQASKRIIHYTPPYRGENLIRLSDALDLAVQEAINGSSHRLIEAIVAQRSIKEEQELEEMESALSITKAMHLEVIHDTRPGLFESDMVAQLLSVAHKHRVDTAYPVILTVNGQTLHNHSHHNQMKAGQLLLGDFGAESAMHYAADITRTIPVSDHFNSQQKEIYALVLDMLTKASEALAPGIPYQEVHRMSAEVLADGMVQLGLMTGDPKEIVADGAHALFFPHGLGHMIGLDVHDMEDLGEDLVGYDENIVRSDQFGTKSLRLGRALQPGFTFTVEPGIYFIPELIDQWQSKGLFSNFMNYDKINTYRDFGGIRVEDNYVITEGGARMLGEQIPKSLEEISFLRSVDRYTGKDLVE